MGGGVIGEIPEGEKISASGEGGHPGNAEAGGDLVFDEKGLAKRGVLVRHLVMPDNTEDSRKIMRFLAYEVSPHTYINIMDQYRPAWKVTGNRYREINRRTTGEEHQETIHIAQEEGLYRFDTRNPTAHLAFTPL